MTFGFRVSRHLAGPGQDSGENTAPELHGRIISPTDDIEHALAGEN